MNITHICLLSLVTDNWTYQDNLLTKYHKKDGNNVTILTSHWIWGQNGKLVQDERNAYINDDGVYVKRLNILGANKFYKKFKKHKNFYRSLVKTKPDIIFVHGCQFLEITSIVKYVKKNSNVIVYVDNHSDFTNSASNWLSKNILHKIIWKKFANKIEPFTKKFYGVLPARVDFLENMYNLPSSKTELLVMGVDDEKISKTKEDNARNKIRDKYNIKKDDFLIVTGGKIDSSKTQTLDLLKAVNQLDEKKIKLIIFGSISDEFKQTVNELCSTGRCKYVGWIIPDKTYDYFCAADLVVFPGRHSVFWEQVAGQGVPLLVKYLEGTTHIDLGGNVRFLYDNSQKEIKKNILNLYYNKKEYLFMKNIAIEKGMKYFSYKDIARRSLL